MCWRNTSCGQQDADFTTLSHCLGAMKFQTALLLTLKILESKKFNNMGWGYNE